MPRIQCDRHGLQGVNAMCSHVQSAAQDKRDVRCSTVCIDEFFFPCVWLCNECRDIWNRAITEDDKEEFLDILTVMCGPCFDEWKEKHHFLEEKNDEEE